MKQILICILLLTGLTACGGKIAASSAGGPCNNDLCIKLTAKEPIAIGQPVSVTIKLTSQKDIPDLKLYLGSDDLLKRVSIEDPSLQGWKKGGFVNWPVNVRAKQSQTFTRKVILPTEEGLYSIIAEAFLPEGQLIRDSIRIYIIDGSGKVYYEGTRIPITDEPLPIYTVTPEPSPTPFPTPTLGTGTPSYP